MKKTLVLIGIIFVLLLSGFANATLDVSDLEFGGKNIQRNNPEGEDSQDRDPGEASGTFTIENKGNTTLTGVDVSFSGLSSVNAEVKSIKVTSGSVSETSFPITLDPTEKVTVTVNGTFDKDFGSKIVDETQEYIEAGTVVVSGNNGSDTISGQGIFKAMAETGLDLKDVKILIDGVSYDYDDPEVKDSDDSLVIPGVDVELKFTIVNEFSKDSNLNIENAEISLSTSVDSSDARDSDFEFGDEEKSEDIKADKEESVSEKFDIDWGDFDDGDTITVTIEVIGTDDNGATHEVSLEFDIEINYLDADLNVDSVSIYPSSVCPGDFVEISFEVENTGTDDQNNLQYQIQQSNLGWNEISSFFKLDGRDLSDVKSESFSEDLQVPEDASVRDYDVKVIAYYKDADGGQTQKWVSESLTVLDCDNSSDDNSGSSNDNSGSSNDNSGSSNDDSDDAGFVVTTGNDEQTSTGTTAGTVTATSKPKNDGLLVGGMIVLAVLLLAVLVSLVMVLTRK